MANYQSLDQAQAKLQENKQTIDRLTAENQSRWADEVLPVQAKMLAAQDRVKQLSATMDSSSALSLDYYRASLELKTALPEALQLKDQLATIESKQRDTNKQIAALEAETEQVETTVSQFTAPAGVVTDPAATNSDTTAEMTQQKYQNAEIVGDASVTENYSNEGRNYGSIGVISPGAMPSSPVPATVSVTSMTGSDRISTDMRVKIRVPTSYLTALTSGLAGAGANDGFPVTPLKALGGVVFPYTPTISVEHKADYATQQPMHSNFALNFYQKSSVSPITITGSFTVQNEKEAATFIATVHLLRALTKMRSGGNKSGDLDSGAPPPVCRLDAYGSFMLDNIPVAISSFKVDFPDNVDYFTLGKQSGTAKSLYDMTAVPVKSSITVTCIPMYSRNEMRSFSVTSWLNNRAIRKGGYL